MRAWLRLDHLLPACIAAVLAGCGGRSVVHLDRTDGGPPPQQQVDTVTCTFSGGVRAACRSHRGDVCEGAGACTVTVRGTSGEQLSWTSSCGGGGTTVIDGQPDGLAFDCSGPIPVDGGPLPPPFDGGPPPPPPPPPVATERVTCQFRGSTTMQECRSTLGQGCTGVAGCAVVVTATAGTNADWKSTCGGYATTVVDGVDEQLVFDCPAVPPPPPAVQEKVTCRFYGSSTTQECYSSLGGSCKGVTSCTVKLAGTPGTLVDWKSSCGGQATTVLDGMDEDAPFKCPIAPPPPPPHTTEKVTCWFDGSNSPQECFSSLGPSCQGVYSCTVTLTGTSGIVVDWKSTCGGYYSTYLDGLDEDAYFQCPAIPPPPPPPPPLLQEQVTCLFLNSNVIQECYSSLGPSCKGVGTCVVAVSGMSGELVTWKSSCGAYAHTEIDGYDEFATFQCGAP